MRSAERLTVPIVLSRSTRQPLHEQLIDALRAAIGSGLLPAGSRLPSTRTLANVLGVSRGVAETAYEELTAAGTIQGAPGSGTYVSPACATPRPATIHGGPELIDLRPGRGITEGFPLAQWRAAWRQASYRLPPPGHPPGAGLADLRVAVAEHVRRVHGYTASEAQIVITSGPRHAVDVLLRSLGAGARCAVTDPSEPWLRKAITAHGVPAVPVPMDDNGILVGAIPSGVDIVVTAPDGGAPLGVRFGLERRERLAEWANRTGGWLVEIGREVPTDPSGRPLPSLLSIGPSAVLIGDLAELLTPAIGLGYLVLPHQLAGPAANLIAATHTQPPLLSQLAAAELIRSGAITRWRNRLAAVHQRKLAIVRAALPGLAVIDARQPGEATVLLPAPADLDRLGLLLCPLRHSYAQPGNAPSGLAVGFGHLEDPLLGNVMRGIAAAIEGSAMAAAGSTMDS
jgi:GntR family transcriptional regulator / MocR family aminotransferase